MKNPKEVLNALEDAWNEFNEMADELPAIVKHEDEADFNKAIRDAQRVVIGVQAKIANPEFFE
jgi:hypothetical protein